MEGSVLSPYGDTDPSTRFKTYLCKLCSLFVYGQGGFARHAKIYLGVDELKISACLKTKLGEEIEAIVSVFVNSAEHHALSVISLLNAYVKVAVFVQVDLFLQALALELVLELYLELDFHQCYLERLHYHLLFLLH